MNLLDINVINGHTGASERLSRADTQIFRSNKTFKEWIELNFLIPTSSSILLTSFGIKFNFNMLNESMEIFVFNRELFANNQAPVYESEISSLMKPRSSPLADQNSLQLNSRNLSSSLTINSGWATAIYSDSVLFNEKISAKMNEISILFKSLNVIFQYFNLFCKDIEKSFQIGLEYFTNLQQKTLNKSWKEYHKQLKGVRFNNIVLSQFLDEKELELNASKSSELFPKVNATFKSMKSNVAIIDKDKMFIDKSIEVLRNDSIKKFKNIKPQDILSKIGSTNEEIQNDIKALPKLSENDLLQLFNKHKNSYITSLQSTSNEIYNILVSLCEFKVTLQKSSINIFSSIASAQMKMVQVKHSLKNVRDDIEKIQNCERALSYTVDLPALYGVYIVENVRRSEWLKEVKQLTSTSAENFAQITEKERKYRDSWLRKFDTFLKILKNNNNFSDDVTPNIELNLSTSSLKGDSYLEYIRNDIERYIETLKRSKIKRETIVILESSLKDLDNKRSGLQKVNIMQITEESELVKGYLLRIKKLESLLHQAQYKNLNQWPSNNVANQFSLVVDANSSSFDSPDKLIRRQTIGDMPKSPRPNKNNSAENTSASRLGETYSNLDKHLDNIRLNKLIHEKDIRLNELTNTNSIQEQEIRELQEQLQKLQKEKLKKEIDGRDLAKLRVLEDENVKLETNLKIKEEEVQKLSEELSDKSSELLEIMEEKQTSIEKYELLLSNASHKIITLTEKSDFLSEEMKKIRSNYQDLDMMKKDLLTNMSSKETEFSKERHLMNEEINLLKLRLEEYEDVEENVEHLKSELIYHKNQSENIVASLNQILASFINKSKELSTLAVKNFFELCLILESIGLLLIRNENGLLQIIRVKGMRSKSKEQDHLVARPNSALIGEIENYADWVENHLFKSMDQINNTGEADNEKSDTISNVTNDSKSVNTDRMYDEIEDEIIKESFKLIDAYTSEQFEINYKSFIEIISIDDKLIVNSIAKRFKDVENLAKKLQKENRSSKDQLISITNEYSSKISIRNFQTNDLVLFLPTRDSDTSSQVLDVNGKTNHPWAAFNIGAPHFFLKDQNEYNLENRDWMLARIKKVAEYHVTKDNFKSEENPFSLSQGVTWYFVEAEEESLDTIS